MRTPDLRFVALTAHGEPDDRQVDAGDGLDLSRPSCAYRCVFCTDTAHGCAYEVTGHRLLFGVPVVCCDYHSQHGGDLNAVALADVSVRALNPTIMSVPPLRVSGADVLECDECGALIEWIAEGARWFHVETNREDPHQAVPACSCDGYQYVSTDIDPRCRKHGHEDVISGAYDRLPEVRRRIDLELARAVDR